MAVKLYAPAPGHWPLPTTGCCPATRSSLSLSCDLAAHLAHWAHCAIVHRMPPGVPSPPSCREAAREASKRPVLLRSYAWPSRTTALSMGRPCVLSGPDAFPFQWAPRQTKLCPFPWWSCPCFGSSQLGWSVSAFLLDLRLVKNMAKTMYMSRQCARDGPFGYTVRPAPPLIDPANERRRCCHLRAP